MDERQAYFPEHDTLWRRCAGGRQLLPSQGLRPGSLRSARLLRSALALKRCQRAAWRPARACGCDARDGDRSSARRPILCAAASRVHTAVLLLLLLLLMLLLLVLLLLLLQLLQLLLISARA